MSSECSSGLQNYFKPPLCLFLFANPLQRTELYDNVILGQPCFEFQAEANSKSPSESLYQGPDSLFYHHAVYVDLANVPAFPWHKVVVLCI